MKKLVFSLLLATCVMALSCDSKTAKAKSASKDEEQMEKVKDYAENSPNLGAGTGKFSIEAPEGWDKETNNEIGTPTVMVLSPIEGSGDTFRENLNVVTENTRGLSMEKYMELTKTNLKNMLQSPEELGGGSTTLDGQAATWLHYSHSYSGNSLEVKAYVAIKDGIAYIITCTAPMGGFDKFSAKFEETIATFKFL